MPGEAAVSKCPICGGIWFEGECYKCGAYIDSDGKMVPPKRESPPEVRPPEPAPVHVQPVRPWDEP